MMKESSSFTLPEREKAKNIRAKQLCYLFIYHPTNNAACGGKLSSTIFIQQQSLMHQKNSAKIILHKSGDLVLIFVHRLHLIAY